MSAWKIVAITVCIFIAVAGGVVFSNWIPYLFPALRVPSQEVVVRSRPEYFSLCREVFLSSDEACNCFLDISLDYPAGDIALFWHIVEKNRLNIGDVERELAEVPAFEPLRKDVKASCPRL